MSDALLKGPVSAEALRNSCWRGVKYGLGWNTVLTGIATGDGVARFRLPLGSWAFPLAAVEDLDAPHHDQEYGSVRLIYSMLDPDSTAMEQAIGWKTTGGWPGRDLMRVCTDPWGFAYAEIAAPVPAGTVGGAIGVLNFDRTYESDVGRPHTEINKPWLRAKRGQPNQPWNDAAMPPHPAVLHPVDAGSVSWNVEDLWDYRIYRAAMTEPMPGSTEHPHLVHPELVPFVDDGSYAWLSVPNVCGRSPLCVDVANGIVYDVYACQNMYAKVIGSASRGDQLQSAGPAIRQKKGDAPMMGLARLPVFPRAYTPGTADPPFVDTFASTERFPAAPGMPWFLPAFITQESGYAMVHIRVAFQNIPHSMGYKDDDGWSFGNGLHEDAPLTALPELLLMRDGNRTNLLSGITLDSAGGSGYSVTHDAGGVTIHARLSATPNLVNHACFVRCRQAYLFIQSPAANGKGAAPAEEENFNPYVEE